MTDTVKHLLYVEGPDDQRIFKKILKDIIINDMSLLDLVDINPPFEVAETEKKGNGVSHLINSLDKVIMRFTQRRDNRLAIVVDADYYKEKGNEEAGFIKRRGKICEIISKHGYIVPEYSSSSTMKGEIFEHQDNEMSPIGLWIMPNHQSDGMMEDLIVDCISHENSVVKILTYHVNPAIERLISDTEVQSHLFDKNKRLNKIKFETWIKWQKGHVFEKDDVLDMEHENIKNLKDWLRRIFVDEYNIEN